MAALPPDSTARYRVEYTTCGRQHTMEIRSVLSPAAIGTFVGDLLTALGTKIFSLTVGVVSFAASGSNVFNPVTSGIEGITYGAGTGAVRDVPKFYNFIGRSTGGRRVRLAVFGAGIDGTDYRVYGSEDTNIDDALSVLVAFGSGIKAIDNITPIWKPYVNMGFNAYWQREVRA